MGRASFVMWVAILPWAVGCESEPGADTDQLVEDPRFPGFAFSEGTLDGCGETIAWQTFTPVEHDITATMFYATGFSEYTDKYHHLLELFGAELGWKIVYYDVRGQGRSSGQRGHVDDFSTQHACDFEALRGAHQETDTLLFLSHSTGGLIAFDWMREHPGVATAGVFSAPLLGIVNTSPHESVCAVAASLVGTAAREPTGDPSDRPPCETNQVTHDCELYDQFVDDPITVIGQPTWGWVHAVCEASDRVRAVPEVFDAPTLMFQAGTDVFVENSKQDEFCPAIDEAGGSCSILRYEENFHEHFMELNRADVVAETVSFFQDAM